MTQSARINNKAYVRGRLVRDPVFTEAKDGSGRQMAFGRVAVDSPYVDSKGDSRVRTDYFVLKVFNSEVASKLRNEGAIKGCLIEANGSITGEREEYEDRETGEMKVVFNVVLSVDTTDGHSVAIESFPSRSRNEAEQAQA
ncbi:single-stranded DNA-binding protein [Hyphomicrobium sp.]|jgi:single-stranded DNA-binding protein|uniref:single-stranded DNA-binding protein n=1 Tax=Hyphomicrobium sp. TaxID=82 RepID=UPI002FE15973